MGQALNGVGVSDGAQQLLEGGSGIATDDYEHVSCGTFANYLPKVGTVYDISADNWQGNHESVCVHSGPISTFKAV